MSYKTSTNCFAAFLPSTVLQRQQMGGEITVATSLVPTFVFCLCQKDIQR